MATVPESVRAPLPPEVLRASVVFGHGIRVAIIESLMHAGPATQSELAERLDMPRSVLQRHVERLEDMGVIRPNPPRVDEAKQRRSFSADVKVVRSLLKALHNYVD